MCNFAYIKGLKLSYHKLNEEREVPDVWKEEDKLPVVSNLLETSLKLAWGKVGDLCFVRANSNECMYFRENYWNLFLGCFKDYIDDVKNGTWWTGFFIKDNKLYYCAAGKPRALPFKRWNDSVQQWWIKEFDTPTS